VGGTYNSNTGALIKETQAGTSTLIAASITGYGSINGNGYTDHHQLLSYISLCG